MGSRGELRRRGFTLVELLVVVSMIALLVSILIPSLGKARRQAKSTVCLANLRTLGQGIALYAIDNNDVLPPGRLPDLGDGVHWRVQIAGGLKYRPTFLAMMGAYLSIPAFAAPSPTKNPPDRYGEPGNQQNYVSAIYVCPAVPHWTDERNGAYGYNYQFLGNSRLRNESDPTSFKNWPVRQGHVKAPARCVAVADSMGTAASFAHRWDYDNNARDADRYGNEGFNLDPPRVDPVSGEMAGIGDSPQHRTAADPRHLDTAGVLWMDAHATRETLRSLRYQVGSDGVIGLEGDNRLFSINGQDAAWVSTP